MAATPTITLTTTSGSIKPCPSRSVESRNEQPASIISVSSSTWSLVPRAQSTISASGTRPAAVTHPCRRLARKPRKVAKAVARATDKGVLRSVLVSVGLVVATAASVWLVWYTTSTKVVSLMADDTMSDTSNIIFNEIHQTVRVLYRQLEFFDLALSFNPNFFGEDRVTEMWSIQTAALLNEQTQFSMIIAPTDPYTFDHLIEPSLLSSQDVALSIVFRVANSSDSIVITIKDGNKSQGQACMAAVSYSAPTFIPVSCIDGTINWPLLLQSVSGKEIAFFDPVHVEFLGFQMFVMSVQKALYSGETPIAWLYTGMEVPTLTTLLSGIDMGTNSFSYIVDSHGKLLAVLGSLTVESTEFGTLTPENSSSTKVVHTWGLLQDKIGSISENETCKMQYSDETDSYFLEVFRYHPHPSAQWLVVISLSSTKYTESSRVSTRFSIIITCALVAVLLIVGVVSAISLSKKRDSVSPEPKIDLDAGITKVLDKLHFLKRHSSKRTTKILDEIISNLTQTGGLFMPDLKKQTCLLDTDIQKWLNEEIAPSKLAPDTPSNVAAPLVSVVSYSNDTFELNSLDFCIFEIPPEGILERVAMQVVSSLELLQALAIPFESFRTFVCEIERLYKANSYHNSRHAADVVQCLYYFLVNGLREIIGPTNYLDMFGLIVSGIIHDVGHPGVNNAFLIATENDLALRYNDRSVLENLHSSLGLKIMSSRVTAEWNFSPNDKKYLRSLIINLVLATDMAQHFEIISKFKTILENPKRDMMQNKEHRTQLLCVAIKTADISNVMRPHKQMMHWVSQLTQEFYNQGDQEKALGVPVSPFTDRSEGVTKLSKLQTNFINIIAEPLLTTFSAACPTPLMIECIKSNNEYWSSNQLHHLSPSGQILPGRIPPVPSPSLTYESLQKQQPHNNPQPTQNRSPSQSPSSKH